jgi:hypothetical protein
MADSGKPPVELVTRETPRLSVEDNTLFSPRSRKQFSIFLAGSYFTIMSAIITRRAVNRRLRWAKPTYFRTNQMHPEQQINIRLEAMEAITVATVNVFSWVIMLGGGVLWATDTSGLAEMRSKLRLRLGLTEEEQKESQAVVGEYIEAVKPWNAFKSSKRKGGDEGGEPAAAEDRKSNERGAS